MAFQTIQIETHGEIATVWMNRPERHNAFDEILIRELTDAFQQIEADNTVRVLVLAGRGASFSAGADLNWMKRAAAATVDENRADAANLARMLATLHRSSKPTIARVHGAAMGGGVGLTAACDIAIASSHASFATTEVRLGIIPAVISPYVIAAIGERTARRYFLTGEQFSAEEAHRIGLVHVLCEANESIDARVAQLTTALLVAGPAAQTAAKELLQAVVGKPIDDRLIADTAERIARTRATPEAKEGIAAFLEKRRPRWRDK